MLRPEVVLDILQNFTLFATDKKHRRIKIICRYQQYFTTNQIVDRVVKGLSEEGSHLAFPGQRQVAAHGFRRAKAADAPEARQSDGDDCG